MYTFESVVLLVLLAATAVALVVVLFLYRRAIQRASFEKWALRSLLNCVTEYQFDAHHGQTVIEELVADFLERYPRAALAKLHAGRHEGLAAQVRAEVKAIAADIRADMHPVEQ